jgi:general secretion pathway protein L
VTDYLFIQLGELRDQATWAAFDAAGRLLTPVSRGSLAAARTQADGRRVVVLVPAAEIVTTQAQVPITSQARLRQMLPFTLEDALAEDVEQLSFAVGPRLPSGAVSVAIVANERLGRWLEDLGAAGLSANAIYSESDGVPETPATLTLMFHGRRCYGRRPGQPPFVLEGFRIEQVLDVVRGSDDPEDLHSLLVYVDNTSRAQQQADVAHLRERGIDADLKLMADGMFPHLAATLIRRPGTNLLQGDYAPKSNWIALARPWRLAASLLVAAGLLTLVAQGAEYVVLRREDGALAQMIAEGCARFVSGGRASACETEVRRRLRDVGQAASGSGENFLTTLAAVADSRTTDTRIEALSYRNNVMDLQLVAPSIPALDQFRSEISGTGRFEAKLESTNPSDAGVEGRVQVTVR